MQCACKFSLSGSRSLCVANKNNFSLSYVFPYSPFLLSPLPFYRPRVTWNVLGTKSRRLVREECSGTYVPTAADWSMCNGLLPLLQATSNVSYYKLCYVCTYVCMYMHFMAGVTRHILRGIIQRMTSAFVIKCKKKIKHIPVTGHGGQ